MKKIVLPKMENGVKMPPRQLVQLDIILQGGARKIWPRVMSALFTTKQLVILREKPGVKIPGVVVGV